MGKARSDQTFDVRQNLIERLRLTRRSDRQGRLDLAGSNGGLDGMVGHAGPIVGDEIDNAVAILAKLFWRHEDILGGLRIGVGVRAPSKRATPGTPPLKRRVAKHR